MSQEPTEKDIEKAKKIIHSVYGFIPKPSESDFPTLLEKIASALAAERSAWKDRALAVGEQLADVGPVGYYGYEPDEWGNWVLTQIARLKAEREGLEKENQQLRSDQSPYVMQLLDENKELKESLRRELRTVRESGRRCLIHLRRTTEGSAERHL